MERGFCPSNVSEELLDAGALYRAHATFVARFLLRLGVPGQEVSDVLQDVFLVAHKRGGFRPGPAKATTWLAEIALRVASQRRRKDGRKREDADHEAISLVPATGASPREQAEARESLERVQKALDRLTPERRAVFVLYEMEGESCESIATGLGIPVGTVYSRLHKARREFVRAHEQLLPGDVGSRAAVKVNA